MRNDAEVYRLRIIEGYAQDVCIAWERLARCEDEFHPEYPGACAEYQQALDEATLLLMRYADPDRWERRQQALRDAVEEILANTCQMPSCGDLKVNHIDGTGVCEVDDCQCQQFWPVERRRAPASRDGQAEG